MDNIDYIILSTPRSGSAWLANFLTIDGRAYCHHEPFADFKFLEEIPRKAQRMGIIDTGCWMLPNFSVPDSIPIYKLTRNEFDVQLSLVTKFGWDSPPHYDYSKFNQIKGVRTFHYKDLFSVSYLEKVWDELIPNLPFCRPRALQLINLNIQVDPNRLVNRTIKTYAGDNHG